MAAEKITAEKRTEFGKGAARRIRREDKIPAVVYGHGNDPIHLTLPGHATMMALKHGGSNALLELAIDSDTQLALAREVQVDPIRRVIEHIDFVAVRLGERVTVDVPVHLVGDAAPDTLVVTENTVVSLEAEATHIPEFIEVDIEGAAIGTQIHASDLDLPEGSTLLTDPEIAGRQHHQRPQRRGHRGGAGGGRGRGRHRARPVRGGGRRGRGRGEPPTRAATRPRPRAPRASDPSPSLVAVAPRPPRGGDRHGRRLVGGRPGQPRADLRRSPPQRGVPRHRRAGRPGWGRPGARTSAAAPTSSRDGSAPPGRRVPGSCWPAPAAT